MVAAMVAEGLSSRRGPWCAARHMDVGLQKASQRVQLGRMRLLWVIAVVGREAKGRRQCRRECAMRLEGLVKTSQEVAVHCRRRALS